MYWSKEACEEYIRYPSEGTAEELGSPIYFVAQYQIERSDEMAEVVQDLTENGYDYAPIRPYHSREYYDVENNQVRSINEEQYIQYNQVIFHCINILTEYPFALATHPDRDCWRIVTPADLNTRTAKEFLFTYYAEAAKAASVVIEKGYEPEDMPEVYESARQGGKAIDRWQKAVDKNVDLHPVEFMSIADMKEIVRNDEKILEKLGFLSKTQCKKVFDKIEKYRNKVMHGNRTVISVKEEVVELTESLEVSCELAANAGGTKPGLDIPD